MNESLPLPHPLIHAHGVVLRRMQARDIENVRQWRNDPAVAQYMHFRDTITPQMQQRWFDGLEPERQFFYIVVAEGREAGLVNLKDYDAKRHRAEGGIYIADVGLRDGHVGLAATLAMYDFGFDTLALETIDAHILRDNTRAIRFNRALGFRRVEGADDAENQKYEMRKADYVTQTAKFRAYLAARLPAHG